MLFFIELIVGLQEKVETLSLDLGNDLFALWEYLQQDDAPVFSVGDAFQASLFFQAIHKVRDGGFGDLQAAADLGHGNGAQEHQLIKKCVLREGQIDPVEHLGVQAGELRMELSEACCEGFAVIHRSVLLIVCLLNSLIY